MNLRPYVAVIISLMLCAQNASAWSDGGHETVAYIAYKRLMPNTRKRVDEVLQRNPMYDAWTRGVSEQQKGLVAFVRAATWADCIKLSFCEPGYTGDGGRGGNDPPENPTDAQNIGYADHLMHKYWHFISVPYSAGAPGQPPKEPNALTEIKLLTDAIGTDESDPIKSYDVVWLEHLVGDVHQPLHAISRFTRNHPNGDAGGNFVFFCAMPCKDELHIYWDGLMGDHPSTDEIAAAGKRLLRMKKPDQADAADPSQWVDESFALAKSVVYVAPISEDNDPAQTISPRPDATYAAAATRTAKSQVLLAGYRLANLLNTHLK
jgi:hypothetical protein